MTPRLRTNERCPLHPTAPGPYFCCGREKRKKAFDKTFRFRKPPSAAVERFTDQATGELRELCSKMELRRRKHSLMEKIKHCFYCREEFNEYSQVELAHLKSCGMNGSKRNDIMSNLTLACKRCNRQNGSRSVA